MAFYTGTLFGGWRGNLLIGGLVSRGLVRPTLDGHRVTGEDRIPLADRIRAVRQGASDDHTSERQSLMRNSHARFWLQQTTQPPREAQHQFAHTKSRRKLGAGHYQT